MLILSSPYKYSVIEIIEPSSHPNAVSDRINVIPISLLIVAVRVLLIKPIVNRNMESAIGARK